MGKKELLEELREKFAETKKRLKFKASFEDINSISYIEDMVLAERYVSNQFSRQMINRMVETFYSWMQELLLWNLPSPYDAVHMNEGKKINPYEKEEVGAMIARIMYLVRKNKRIAFQELKGEGEFIDELVEFNKKHFTPFMVKYNQKFEEYWKENALGRTFKNSEKN